jgi:Coenzyme PQQ synthesis protein D (PqqD)
VTGERSTRVVGPPRATVQALELDGDISLYDSATSQALVLNTTASDVWRLLDGEHTMDEVVGLLAAAYAVDTASIRPDVVRIVGELTTAGLLAS